MNSAAETAAETEEGFNAAAAEAQAAEQEAAAAEAAKAEVDTALAGAQSALDEAEAAQEAAGRARAEAAASKTAADAAAAEAERQLSDAETQLEAEQSNQEETAAVSSLDFYRWALENTTDEEEKRALNIAISCLTGTVSPYPRNAAASDWATYAGYTHLGAANDATSLENIRKTFDFIRVGNERRAADGLSPMLVNDAFMAMAQMNANWSHESGHTHAKQYSAASENLAWIYNGDECEDAAYTAWYDNEKEVYEKAMEEGTNPDYGQVGHYLNLADPYSVVTGVGVNSENYDGRSLTVSQTMGSSLTLFGRCYTVDEYEERFMKYYNTLPVQGEALARAQAEVDAARAALAAAQLDQQGKTQALTDAEESAAQAAQAFQAASRTLAEASVAATNAAGNASVRQEARDAAEQALAEARAEYDRAREVYRSEKDRAASLGSAMTARETAERVVEENTAALDSAAREYQQAYEEYTAAREDLAESQAALDEAVEEKTRIEALVGSTAASDSIRGVTEEEIRALTGARDAAKAELEQAQAALLEAGNGVAKAEARLGAAEAGSTQAGTAAAEATKRADAAVAAALAADGELAKAQACLDSLAERYGSLRQAAMRSDAAGETLRRAQEAKAAAQQRLLDAAAAVEELSALLDKARADRDVLGSLTYEEALAALIEDGSAAFLNVYFDAVRAARTELSDAGDMVALLTEALAQAKAEAERAAADYVEKLGRCQAARMELEEYAGQTSPVTDSTPASPAATVPAKKSDAAAQTAGGPASPVVPAAQVSAAQQAAPALPVLTEAAFADMVRMEGTSARVPFAVFGEEFRYYVVKDGYVYYYLKASGKDMKLTGYVPEGGVLKEIDVIAGDGCIAVRADAMLPLVVYAE